MSDAHILQNPQQLFEQFRHRLGPLIAWFSRKSWNKNVPENWQARLNQFLADFELMKVVQEEPEVQECEKYEVGSKVAHHADEKREELQRKGRPDDPHARVRQPCSRLAENSKFVVEPIYFSQVQALRAFGDWPPILSAGGIVICRQQRSLILHRRGSDVDTYRDCLHILGGGYKPPAIDGPEADRKGLRQTAVREIHEEAQVEVVCCSRIIFVSKENPTNFYQVVYCFNVSPESLDDLCGNWEGGIERVNFDSLPRVLNEEHWVPSGKALVLAWLAEGAPGALWPRFDQLRPSEVFNQIVPKDP